MLIIHPRSESRQRGLWIAHISDELLAHLIKAHQRVLFITWSAVNFEHVLHRADEGGTALRWQAPLLHLPRF
jgi:hypothetical protein